MRCTLYLYRMFYIESIYVESSKLNQIEKIILNDEHTCVDAQPPKLFRCCDNHLTISMFSAFDLSFSIDAIRPYAVCSISVDFACVYGA